MIKLETKFDINSYNDYYEKINILNLILNISETLISKIYCFTCI